MAENQSYPLQVWAGLECTINRVDNNYYNQLAYSGHYKRIDDDIEAIAALGVKTLRYPILWEHNQPAREKAIDWTHADTALSKLREKGIEPIAGLVHHGSGPKWVSFYDGSFENGLRDYALQLATRYPWIEYYTPVNEPVTTARFCGLYALWYPHKTGTEDFCRILISECKATVLAMQAIRSINPNAKLVQTEDLGKTYSTPTLQYQADYENRRRWLGFELLCGFITPTHAAWSYFTEAGIEEEELRFFVNNPTPPDIMGFNYYATSERYIDEDMCHYPGHTRGGNGIHNYADVEAVRVPMDEKTGLPSLLRYAWERYHLPIAITEAHLHCHREHQSRWLHRIWRQVQDLRDEGIDLRAVTAWAALGSFGWNKLLCQPKGDYEPGLFDVRSGKPRPTALARLVKQLVANADSSHPLIEGKGWWEDDLQRLLYKIAFVKEDNLRKPYATSQPLLILGKTGTLGKAFARICAERDIHYELWGREELDISSEGSFAQTIAAVNPWAVINATGYVRVEDAEYDSSTCFRVNCVGAIMLAHACGDLGIPLLSFSSDLVFDGTKASPYLETDLPRPLNTYGRSKSAGEAGILHHHPKAMIVRTSAFFGPWDEHNFAHAVLQQLAAGNTFTAASDVMVTPTYVPDLVHNCLDLLQDDVSGIWHIANSSALSWADFARKIADYAGYDPGLIRAVPYRKMGLKAAQPANSALASEKGIRLPSLSNAIERFFNERAVQDHEIMEVVGKS